MFGITVCFWENDILVIILPDTIDRALSLVNDIDSRLVEED